tara:strand:- start:369 stop:527 length:159 start_codon:yes stop_codon:yes gene_type:complete
MKEKIINWFLDQVGIMHAFERIEKLEETVEELDITINALQMEADILLAKTQK